MPKKRGNGDGGLYYIKSRKLWRGVVDVGFRPDGRRRQEYVHSRSRKEAYEKLEALKAEVREHGAPLDKMTTVAKWADHWIETVKKPTLKPASLSGYQSIINSWIVPTIGKKRVAEVKPSDVRIVMKVIRDAGHGATQVRAYAILHAMMESARKDGLCARNVVSDVDKPKVIKTERMPLTLEQAHAVLEAAAGDPLGTRWWAALLAAMRQAERLGATVESLDLAAAEYHVEWQLKEIPFEHGCGDPTDGEYPCERTRAGSCPDRHLRIPNAFEYRQVDGRLCLIRPKSGKPRTIPLVPQLVAALDGYLVATKDWPNPHGLLWRHPDGSPVLAGEDIQAWRDTLHAAGIITADQARPPRERTEQSEEAVFGTHAARHTTITILMELGIDAKIIGEIVGHGSVEVTKGYQHVTSTAAREAMERLGQRMELTFAGLPALRDAAV